MGDKSIFETDTPLFPVIGIGGRADDREQILRLLEDQPRDLGAAFVVMTGDEKLQRDLCASRIALVEVKTPTKVEPGLVYMPPSGLTLWLDQGQLVAIGDSDDGEMTDGWASVQAYFGTRATFIDLDEVTTEVAAEQILRVKPSERPQIEMADLGAVLELLRGRTGRDFSPYKLGTLRRRIEHRLRATRSPHMEAYLEHLRTTPSEAEVVVSDLLIGVTSFFRDPTSFQVLQREVLRPMAGRSAETRPVRVWVAGCSTGEEAYAVAILLREAGLVADEVQILATDLDGSAIAVARRGRYPLRRCTGLATSRRNRFFRSVDRVHLEVVRELREMVTFARHDLFSDPPFTRLDMVSCRNLLIYLEPDAQGRLISVLHGALEPGGALFLGAAETVGEAGARLFEPIDKDARLYRAIGVVRSPEEVGLRVSTVRSVPPARAAWQAPVVVGGEPAQALLEVNEELRSANEELETAKDELRALSDGLRRSNEELRQTVRYLARSRDDMTNLLDSTEIATLFVDRELRVRRFTERSAAVVRLIPSDVGRPISDLTHSLGAYDLAGALREVLATLEPLEAELTSSSGARLLMRVLPYRATDNVVDGLVVTFVDITSIPGAEKRQRRVETALRRNRTMAFGQDRGLVYTWATPSLFGASTGALVGRTDQEIFSSESAARLTEIKTVTMTERRPSQGRFSLRLEGRTKQFELLVSPAFEEDGGIHGISGVITETGQDYDR